MCRFYSHKTFSPLSTARAGNSHVGLHGNRDTRIAADAHTNAVNISLVACHVETKVPGVAHSKGVR